MHVSQLRAPVQQVSLKYYYTYDTARTHRTHARAHHFLGTCFLRADVYYYSVYYRPIGTVSVRAVRCDARLRADRCAVSSAQHSSIRCCTYRRRTVPRAKRHMYIISKRLTTVMFSRVGPVRALSPRCSSPAGHSLYRSAYGTLRTAHNWIMWWSLPGDL